MLSQLTSLHMQHTAPHDIRFFVAPCETLTLAVSTSRSFANGSLLSYQVVGSKAAISLLNRLSREGEDASTIRGNSSPITAVTLDDDAKRAASIPLRAAYYSFAYPLDVFDADVNVLLSVVIGSVSRLDDELLFFFLFGGFIYFDAARDFLVANSLSLKESPGALYFDGPYPVAAAATKALKRMSRLRPLTLAPLNDVGLKAFGWVNPSEMPHGEALHSSLQWRSGAFVYLRRDESLVFYRTVSGCSALPTPDHLCPITYAR